MTSNQKNITTNENHLDEQIQKWFAVYTPHKREKIAARYLRQQGIEVYLPLQTLTRQYVRKVKTVDLPFIPHYIFVKITKAEYTKVLGCPYVSHFVQFSRNLVSIPEEEIDLIRRVLGERNTTTELVDLSLQDVQKGDEVEVVGGHLTGLKGIMVGKESNQYLSVRLHRLGFTLNISIAVHLLRKIKSDISSYQH